MASILRRIKLSAHVISIRPASNVNGRSSLSAELAPIEVQGTAQQDVEMGRLVLSPSITALVHTQGDVQSLNALGVGAIIHVKGMLFARDNLPGKEMTVSRIMISSAKTAKSP